MIIEFEKMDKKESDKIRPTLELYYNDTVNYFEVYKEKILKWAKKNDIPSLKVQEILIDAQVSLLKQYKQDCEFNDREVEYCPALNNLIGEKNDDR